MARTGAPMRRAGRRQAGWLWLLCLAGLVSWLDGSGRLAAGEPAAPAAPPASKVAVIYLEKVAFQSSQYKDMLKVEEDLRNRLRALQQDYQRKQADQLQIQKNLELGVGNRPEMQDRWLKIMQEIFKLEDDMKQLQATGQDQLIRMKSALMVDINRAIEQVALREKIDVVINRKDAELAAVQKKKLKETWLAREAEGSKTEKTGKLDEDLEQELTQLMLSKLQNTFVWSNDSMDITDAAVAQLNQDYKDQKFTNWRDMPSAGDDTGPGAGGPAGP